MAASNRPGQPSSSPESVYRTVLAADARPAIRAASGPQLRAALNDITTHLCDYVRRHARHTVAAPGQWPGPIEAGAMQFALELFDDVRRAVAASWLHALRFDPGRAAAEPDYHGTVVGPVLAAARKYRLRGLLLTLADRIRAATTDADTSAALVAVTPVPDDIWDVGTGVSAAMVLYQHAVLVEAAHVWYYLPGGLGTGQAPVLPPIAPPPHPARNRFLPVSPN
jgi:hypothetical protein